MKDSDLRKIKITFEASRACAQARRFVGSVRIKTEALALDRPLIEHRDAVMAVQWLVEKWRASGEIPVAFCITISRESVHLPRLPSPPFPLFRRFRLFVLFSVA